MIDLINEDCITAMNKMIKDGVKIDAIIADVPYNIKQATWDSEFPIEEAIECCSHLLKENGNIIIFQGWSNVIKTKLQMDKYFKIKK